MMGNGFLFQPSGKPIVTAWQSYTPTGAWTTNTTYTGRYRQVGDTGFFLAQVVVSGAPDNVALTVNLPSGLTFDTAKMTTATAGSRPIVGQLSVIDDSTGTIYFGRVSYGGASSVQCYIDTASGTYSTASNFSQTVPITFANNDSISIFWSGPITGWS